MPDTFSVTQLTVSKVKVHTFDIVTLRKSSPQKRLCMARVLKRSQFYLHTYTFIRNRNKPYLPLPSQLCVETLKE